MIDPVYGIWVDRDLLRASQIFEFFPVMGAELNGTYYARTPGGAYYYILGFLSAVSSDPIVVTRILIVLSVFGGLAVYDAAARIWGAVAGLVAAGIWLTSPLILGAGFQVINPAVGVPISGFCYLMFVRFFRGERKALYWLAFLLGILIQTHISFLALGITFGISIVIFRRPRWRDGGGAVITFLLTFTPYIIVEAMNGFVNTGLLILGRDEPNPVYTSLKFNSLDFFFHSVTNPIFQSQTAKFMGGIVIFFMMFFSVILATRRFIFSSSGTEPERDADRIVLGLAIVLLIGVVLLAWGRGFSTQPRYFVFLVPAIALLMGGVTASVLNWMQTTDPWITQGMASMVALILIVLSCGPVWRSIETFNQAGMTQTRVQQLSSLIRAVKAYTGYNREEINGQVVVIGSDGALHEDYASYLAETVEAPIKKNIIEKPSCLAVVRTADVKRSDGAFETFMASMPFTPAQPTLVGRDMAHSLYGYRLESGNCYKNLGNSYDHFPEERFARGWCDQAKTDGVVWKEQDAQGMRVVIRDTFEHVRLCFRIDMARVKDRFVGTVYSWQGRSYSGYPIDHWSFMDLALEFSGQSMTVRRPLISVPLGRFKFSRLPWKFNIDAPTPGKYDVAVIYDMAYQETADTSRQVFDEAMPRHIGRQTLLQPFEVAP